MKSILSTLFLVFTFTLDAQNYFAKVKTFVTKIGTEEKIILIESGNNITDSIVVFSFLQQDISFFISKNYFYCTYKSNSDVETSKSTFYLHRYEINEGKLKLINQKWVYKSFTEAEKYKYYLLEGNFIIEYLSDDLHCKYQRKIDYLNVDDFELIDKKFLDLINIK